MTGSETFAFQAEINQLLSLIINTFYSNKDVFLRELISNASDALDKIRYKSLTDKSALEADPDLKIQIRASPETNTLHIRDTGIGMTKADLIKNLGTIAHSGTKSFIETVLASKSGEHDALSLIGQFGVGFYAAFLVADKVSVHSKHNQEERGYIWESNASGSFTICEDDDSLARGTEIVLHIKEDLKEYLDERKIRDIVKKHSEFIGYPIELLVEREEPASEEKEEKDVEEGAIENVEEKEEDKKQMVKKSVWDVLNPTKPVWMRKPEEVSKEEYESFYKSISNDWDNHSVMRHFNVDGQLQFNALLYFPKRLPFDMFQSKNSKKSNIRLYVRKVFITDQLGDELVPDYLSFVHGIVDSDDLPLNISREMLQQNRVMKVIKKNIVKKCIEAMSELAEDSEKYKEFYSNFSKPIKLGVYEDTTHREKLLELLRFDSTYNKEKEQSVSLKDYVTRMKDTQKGIYYIIGENRNILYESPLIERVKNKGYEVLLMTDPLDEYVMQHVKEYSDKALICCSKDGMDVDEDEDEKKQFDDLKEKMEPFCNKIKSVLGNKVQTVVLSKRIVDAPCVLVSDQYGWSANMERIMKAQALNDNQMMGLMSGRRILEINPHNNIIQELDSMASNSEKQHIFNSMTKLMYETATLSSGFSIDDPTGYAKHIFKLMQHGLNLDEDVDVEENDSIEEVEHNNDNNNYMEEVD